MVYSIFIIRKAQAFGIDLNDSAGILWVCKYMLDGLWSVFADDLRKAVANIDGLEEELRELKNALMLIRRSRKMSISFINTGYVTSIDEILQGVQEAYTLVCAASFMLKNEGHTFAAYNHVVRNFTLCQEEIDKALQGFCFD